MDARGSTRGHCEEEKWWNRRRIYNAVGECYEYMLISREDKNGAEDGEEKEHISINMCMYKTFYKEKLTSRILGTPGSKLFNCKINSGWIAIDSFRR